MQQAPSPLYGEDKVIHRFRVRDLLWRPAGELIRFVAVIPHQRDAPAHVHESFTGPHGYHCLYGLRLKIEHCFKQALRPIGSFAIHFLMRGTLPLRRRNGNQYFIANQTGHVFIQARVVAQGLLQYLAIVGPKLLWGSSGSWLRTIRPGIPPSEFVVAVALRQTLPDFLLVSFKVCALAKFIVDRQETQNMGIFRMTA